MDIKLLGYVGMHATMGSDDLDRWQVFAKRLLACDAKKNMASDGTSSVSLRLDEKSHRLLIVESQTARDPFFGLEVESASALQSARGELAARGIAVESATPEELALRKVQDFIHFKDPAGYRLEIYYGLEEADEKFTPGRPMGGFLTGEYGVGHAVLVVPDLDKSRDFYCDVLNFKVSDYLLEPTRRVFMHINGRHHSIALSERPGFGIAHLMFEVNEFDDVGRAYDVALNDYADKIFSTLGRHANDFMTSFYIQTPSNVPIEYGWGGRIVDDATWKVANLFGPSLWGHDRPGSPPTARKVADEQRNYAFEHGLTAPMVPFADNPAFDQEKFYG